MGTTFWYLNENSKSKSFCLYLHKIEACYYFEKSHLSNIFFCLKKNKRGFNDPLCIQMKYFAIDGSFRTVKRWAHILCDLKYSQKSEQRAHIWHACDISLKPWISRIRAAQRSSWINRCNWCECIFLFLSLSPFQKYSKQNIQNEKYRFWVSWRMSGYESVNFISSKYKYWIFVVNYGWMKCVRPEKDKIFEWIWTKTVSSLFFHFLQFHRIFWLLLNLLILPNAYKAYKLLFCNQQVSVFNFLDLIITWVSNSEGNIRSNQKRRKPRQNNISWIQSVFAMFQIVPARYTYLMQ